MDNLKPFDLNGQYYTKKQVAQIFEKTERAVQVWINKGLLEAVQLPGLYLIPKQSVDNFEQPKLGRPSDKDESEGVTVSIDKLRAAGLSEEQIRKLMEEA